MSEAVWNLVNTAWCAHRLLVHHGHAITALAIERAIAAVESELCKSPQQIHEEHLQEVLKWNR